MNNYISDEDVAETIFKKHFLISIPQIFRYTDQELNEVGVHSTGDKILDTEMMNTKLNLYATIIQMMEFYSRGSPIWFSSRGEVKEIYELLTRHMEIWLHLLRTQIGVPAPPLEDFAAMDEFAMNILPLTAGAEDLSPQTGLRGKLKSFNRGLIGISSRISQPSFTAKNVNLLKHSSCFPELVMQLGGYGREHTTIGNK